MICTRRTRASCIIIWVCCVYLGSIGLALVEKKTQTTITLSQFGRKSLVYFIKYCKHNYFPKAHHLLTWYIGFFKKINILLPSMKITYFCKISFISPAGYPDRGNNCISNRLFWTNFSSQIQKMVWVIYGCSKQQSLLFNLLPRVWSKHFSLKYLFLILCLIMWNKAHFSWWYNGIFLAKIQ